MNQLISDITSKIMEIKFHVDQLNKLFDLLLNFDVDTEEQKQIKNKYIHEQKDEVVRQVIAKFPQINCYKHVNPCPVCDILAKTKKQLAAHILSKHSDFNFYYCGDCNEFFRDPREMRTHKRILNHEYNYSCLNKHEFRKNLEKGINKIIKTVQNSLGDQQFNQSEESQ
ncbi:hypothetical protein pb186bvf_012582 [Paramecium bursaria]